jgi:hypothetical protein
MPAEEQLAMIPGPVGGHFGKPGMGQVLDIPDRRHIGDFVGVVRTACEPDRVDAERSRLLFEPARPPPEIAEHRPVMPKQGKRPVQHERRSNRHDGNVLGQLAAAHGVGIGLRRQ